MSKRTVLSIWRDPMATFLQVGSHFLLRFHKHHLLLLFNIFLHFTQVVVMAAFAVIVGLIYFDLRPTLKAGIQDRYWKKLPNIK